MTVLFSRSLGTGPLTVQNSNSTCLVLISPEKDIASVLSSLPTKQQLLVIASSSSGALLDLLSEEGRTVITATKSGRERQAVLFPGFWAEAMSSESADTNKDELLSATEAFRYTEKKLQEYYESKDLFGV